MLTQLIIFDFDGVLAHSEPTAFDNLSSLYAAHFANPKVKDFAAEYFDTHHGQTHLQMGHPLLKALGDAGLTPLLNEEQREAAYRLIQSFHHASLGYRFRQSGLPTSPKLVDTLKALQKKGLTLAIGSNSAPDRLQFSISSFVDEQGKKIGDEVFEIFGKYLFSAPREFQKPHPHVFQQALDATNIAPENAVVVEDSPLGIQAAKAANIGKTIGYTGLNHNPSKHEKDLLAAGADIILHDFTKLPEAL